MPVINIEQNFYLNEILLIFKVAVEIVIALRDGIFFAQFFDVFVCLTLYDLSIM